MSLVGSSDELMKFWETLTVEELKREIQKLYKYQQGLMFNCHTRKFKPETYVTSLVFSQSTVTDITEVIIKRLQKENRING